MSTTYDRMRAAADVFETDSQLSRKSAHPSHDRPKLRGPNT